MNQSIEQWRPVVGYEGVYEVSDHGRVRNVAYRDARGNLRQARIKRLTPDTSGHLQTTLTGDGAKRQVLVHRLVLEAFIGECPPGMHGLHWDDDPLNNHISNLRWGTRSDNMRDRVRNGMDPNANRTHCPRGHALRAPNLTQRHAAMGKRGCWACDRERTEAKRDGHEFSSERADAWYERIMSGWTPTPMAERTECPRGHQLSGGNLRKWQFENRGQRSCRACSTESSAAVRQGRPFSQARADALASTYLHE